jgi:hypothetical protein
VTLRLGHSLQTFVTKRVLGVTTAFLNGRQVFEDFVVPT